MSSHIVVYHQKVDMHSKHSAPFRNKLRDHRWVDMTFDEESTLYRMPARLHPLLYNISLSSHLGHHQRFTPNVIQGVAKEFQ